MKPTSIIFLILAAVLIIAGVVICLVGNSMASPNESLICDSVVDGNDITNYVLTEFDLMDIDINVKNAKVSIISNSEVRENHIEFKNINKVTYDLVINNHKLTLSSVNPFNVSSMVKFRENESGFGGLRHYLFLNKYKGKECEITVYITPDTRLSNIKVHTKSGDIVMNGIVGNTKYDLSADKGNVTFDNINTLENVTANVKGGNFTFDHSKVNDLDFTIENGNGNFNVGYQYSYVCQCVNGSIHLDGESLNDSLNQTYPIVEPMEGMELEIPGEITGKVTSGDLYIVTVEEAPMEIPEEVPEEVPEETEDQE